MTRYSILHNSSTWCYHYSATGSKLDGKTPKTAATVEADTYPTVRAGRAEYTDLTSGGLFTMQAAEKKPFIVEAIDDPASATIVLLDRANLLGTGRTVPIACPFRVAANEVIKVTNNQNGKYIGILYRLEGEKLL